MKRILLVALLSVTFFQGYSQSLIGLYGGAGCATSNNYDVAPSGGLELLFGAWHRTFIGADIFYQTYSLYADNEANSAKHGSGTAGAIERLYGSYVFLAPKISIGFRRTENFKINLTFGVGYNISGFDSVRKWDHGYYTNAYYTNNNSGTGQYDSSLDMSKNLNKLMMRVGVGMTEYAHIGGSWFLTFTEDFGFTFKPLSQTGTYTDPSRTAYTTVGGLHPGYISLQVGISHKSKPKEN